MAWGGNLRDLLRLPGFRVLYASRLTSQSADGVFQACLLTYVLFSPERATSAAALAASLAIVVLPFSVIGPFAGIVLDRVSRQRVLVVSSLVRAMLLAVLVILIAAGHTGADFYVAALAVVSVNRFVLAALSAGLPLVVGVEQLITANALSVTSGTVATLAGGGIGSGLRSLTGGGDGSVALVAGLSAVAYLIAAATAARAGRLRFGPDPIIGWQGAGTQARRVVADLGAGARMLWRTGPARRALGALTASRAAYGLVLVMTVLLYRNYFTGSAGGLGGLAATVAASGVGTVAAALVTPRVTRRMPKARWIMIVLVGGGVAEIALGLPFSSPLFVLAGLLLGFSAQASKICVDTIVQEDVPDTFRGRAFALYDLLFNVAFVAAAALAAVIVPETGRSAPTIVGAGLGYLLAGLLYYRVASRHPEDMRIRAMDAPRRRTPPTGPAGSGAPRPDAPAASAAAAGPVRPENAVAPGGRAAPATGSPVREVGADTDAPHPVTSADA